MKIMRWNWAVVIPILALGIISITFYNIDAGRHQKLNVRNPFSMELLLKDIHSNVTDRFDDHIRSCVPFYHLMQEHINVGTGNRNQPFLSMTLVGAYMFPDYSVVTTEADGRFNQTVFCRYLDVNLNEIMPAVESVVFPEFTVYCCKRSKAHYMSVTTTKNEEINQTVPVTDRSIDDPIYTLSMCVKPMYGVSTKFLLFAEYIEHYKLQGVQHFYIYVKDMDPYTEKVHSTLPFYRFLNLRCRKLVKHYVKSGEAEVMYFREEQDRPSIEWHLVGTQDCIHRSRHHSKYTIYADMDERILPENKNTTLAAYTEKIMTERENIGMIRFVTQYVLKNRTDPVVYEGEKTLKEHMPTLVFHNSSAPAPVGHTAKCIIDPKKVFLMWVHHVEIYFPGYNGYEVPTSEGIIRHFRDIMSGDWYKYYLPEVENFGPFEMTRYPSVLMEHLYQNLKKKLDFVYMRK